MSYAYAVKAGPWIFLTGHEAFDFESGIPEEVAGPSGFPLFGRPRSRREGDFILQRMRRILREFGSDLGNAVRLDQYYPTMPQRRRPSSRTPHVAEARPLGRNVGLEPLADLAIQPAD